MKFITTNPKSMRHISMQKSLFLIFTFLAIFICGVSRESVTISFLFSIPAICLGLFIVSKERKRVEIPKNFLIITAFVIVLAAYLFFIKEKVNPFNYLCVFAISTIFWLIFHNLKQGREILFNLILKLTLTYSVLYLITKIFKLDSVPLSKLYFMENIGSRHYHIGDLWAFTLVLILGKNWGNFNIKTWLLIDLGFLFLVLSNARSAYVSLILGFLYLISRKIGNGNYKKIIPGVFIALVIALFIFASASKTTLLSRPYFLQSIEGFVKYPLGIGMGNFKQIGMEYYAKNGDTSKFSLYTHNIFLEALSGVGVFSIFFLYFLYVTVKDVLSEKKRNLEWGAVILAILANFMFDTTYTIPGMIWIMFMFLGVYGNRSSQSKN